MSTFPQVTLADLSTLAESSAEQPVLCLDETGQLTVDPEAHVPHGSIVLTQEQLVDIFHGSLDGSVQDQWEALDEEFSRDDVLEHLKDEINEDIDRILTERREREALEAELD